MTTINKSTHGPEQGHDIHAASSFYGGNKPINAIIDEVEDDVMKARDDHGRFAARVDSDRSSRTSSRVSDSVSRVAKSAQKTAKRTAERAQVGAKSTAQAVRDHPAMTAAVLGGIATAAYAGVRLYRARGATNGAAEGDSAPKRKAPAAAHPTASKKH